MRMAPSAISAKQKASKGVQVCVVVNTRER
jgi:hypothetical protein